MYCDGFDLRGVPLIERKEFLRGLLQCGQPFFYADHQLEKGREPFELARQQGLEGIIGKNIHSSYIPGRSHEWVKFKVTSDLDTVVAGYTAPRGSREYFGALLLLAAQLREHVGHLRAVRASAPVVQRREASRLSSPPI